MALLHAYAGSDTAAQGFATAGQSLSASGQNAPSLGLLSSTLSVRMAAQCGLRLYLGLLLCPGCGEHLLLSHG